MDQKKKEYVINLIKKSLALGIDENDIIDTLKEASLSEQEARILISEASSNSTEFNSVSQKKPEPKKIINDNVKDLSIGDQITMQLGLEVKEKKYDSRKNVEKKQSDKNISTNSVIKPIEKKGIFSKFKKDPVVVEKKLDNIDESGNSKENIASNGVNVIPKRIDNFEKKELDNSVEKSVNERFENNNTNSSQSLKFSDNSKFSKKESSSIDYQKKFLSDFGTDTKLKEKYFGGNENDSNLNSASNSNSVDGSIEELWKKGIVVAVNSRLNEMKRIRDEIDYLLNSKVDSAVKKETGKFKILLESQKDLIVSSNKEALEQKQKEISFIIDAKLAEIKKESGKLNEYMKQIDESKTVQEELLNQINNTLNEAKKTKSQLLIEVNSELIKSKSQAQEFIDNAKLQLEELDSRINKTLEFEKNIAEGLIHEAEQKIENLTIQKADDLLEEMELKLNNLKSIEKNIDLESIEQKIKMLDQFKKEFLNNMEENISKINKAINLLNEKNDSVSKEINEKILVIDAKLEELTKFEKTFADNMEKIIKDNKKN